MASAPPVATVKIYRVGGSVRDELLGRPVADRDWVVVGATPEMLIASGYKPVGRDFPGLPASGDAARNTRWRAPSASTAAAIAASSSSPRPT